MNVKTLLHLMAVLTVTIGSAALLTTPVAPPPHPSPVAPAAPSPDPPAPTMPRDAAPSSSDSITPSAPTLSRLADSPVSPASPVKLIFIHHSCGENWLTDGDGRLGIELMNNNYFVSDTNYGWGPEDADLGYDYIGDHTDIGHWYNWFVGPNSITYTNALYNEFGDRSYYSRLSDPEPSRENEIIMFKSCYPNSYISGNPTAPPTTGDNPLRGQDAWSEYMSVANIKGIYNDILDYFATRQDKLFVLIVSPPQIESETDATHAANARAVANWLVSDWLDGYTHNNVAVFDFYNVLTSNGGATRTDDPNTNDLGTTDGNHHRWWEGAVQHIQTVNNNFSAYGGGTGGGSHPTTAGNLKATAEFVPLLNVFYNRWKSGAPTPTQPSLSLTAPTTSTSWPVNSQQSIQWSTTGTITQVNLAYALGGSFSPIASDIANTGVYPWTTPATPTTSAQVRVESAFSPTTVYDVSGYFTLYDVSAFTHTVYLPSISRNHTTQPPACPRPLTGVSISGPTSGGLTLHTFTASLTPSDATTPVTYTWSGTPTSGQGTASASYQWTTPGVYTITLVAQNCGGPVTDTHTITVTDTPTTGLDVTLTISNPSSTARTDEPVTSGVPIARDLNLTDLSPLRLLDGGGQPVAAQFTPLARWGGAPDDTGRPVRWLLLDFQANVPANATASYRLVDSGGATPVYPTLTVTDGATAVTVDTGAAQFSISKTDGRLDAPDLAAPLSGRAHSDGAVYTTTGPVTVTVKLNGPMRAAVHVQGAYRDTGGTPLLEHTSRYWFYAGLPIVRLFHTVENNNLCPLVEYGQLDCYDIGSGSSVTVTDVSLMVPTDLGASLTYQAAGEGIPANGNLTADLLLYQDSSGTDYWDTYPTFTDWYDNPLDTRPRMQSYVSFRGYSTTLGTAVVDSGDHAAGWLSLTGSSGSWTVGVRDFWQNFPKALRASTDGTIEIGLFPDEFGPTGYGFNLRAGEHKTHEILLSPSSTHPQTPILFAQAPAQWYVDSGAFGLTALVNFTDWPDHENYVNYQLDTAPTYEEWMDWYPNLPTAIESTDFYGMFDYGDWPIDYEGYHVAPLNVKYDSDYGMWLQWARGGDPRWFRLAEAADRHAADIDILHNLHSPRHWGDGIAFGHSYHDEDGFLNPHRNYGGNHPDTAFGAKGMLLTYYLTGYEKAYQSALELADCIEYRLHNDWHLCDFFPPGECSGEGYGLGDSGGLYEGGSRPAANALSIAVAAYQATADPRYLTVADAVVDWAKASDQPYINGPTGAGQMMKPQMLNMYLRALADYLEMRDQAGLPDTYDAEGSFLAYGDWLHTYPWLDLAPIDTGPCAAYPYEWWFDERAENDDPTICNWLLLGGDAMAYAHHLDGTGDYLDWATRLFRTGSRDPWFEGDDNTYSSTKETANSVAFGHIFLHEWEAGD